MSAFSSEQMPLDSASHTGVAEVAKGPEPCLSPPENANSTSKSDILLLEDSPENATEGTIQRSYAVIAEGSDPPLGGLSSNSPRDKGLQLSEPASFFFWDSHSGVRSVHWTGGSEWRAQRSWVW